MLIHIQKEYSWGEMNSKHPAAVQRALMLGTASVKTTPRIKQKRSWKRGGPSSRLHLLEI